MSSNTSPNQSSLVIAECTGRCNDNTQVIGQGSGDSYLEASNNAKNQLVLQCAVRGGLNENTTSCKVIR